MADDERTPDAAGTPDWARLARELAAWDGAGARRPADDARRGGIVPALGAALRIPDPAPPSPEEVERALAAVMARRGEPARRAHVAPARSRAPLWGAAVAGLLVAVVLAAHDRADVARVAAKRATTGTGTIASTRVGQVDSLRLPDGSRVVLGPSSTVETLAGYGAATREIRLRGEAFLDVVHDPARPFIVHTARGVLRDLGTSFVVRTDAAAGLVVTVHSGAVGVRAAHAPPAAEQRLAAGDRATLAGEGPPVVERGAASDADVAFTRGQLVLRDADVREVAEAMRRWYGIDLRVSDGALLGRRVTATFAAESGPDVARIVAAALGGTVRLAGDTAFVTSTER